MPLPLEFWAGFGLKARTEASDRANGGPRSANAPALDVAASGAARADRLPWTDRLAEDSLPWTDRPAEDRAPRARAPFGREIQAAAFLFSFGPHPTPRNRPRKAGRNPGGLWGAPVRGKGSQGVVYNGTVVLWITQSKLGIACGWSPLCQTELGTLWFSLMRSYGWV